MPRYRLGASIELPIAERGMVGVDDRGRFGIDVARHGKSRGQGVGAGAARRRIVPAVQELLPLRAAEHIERVQFAVAGVDHRQQGALHQIQRNHDGVAAQRRAIPHMQQVVIAGLHAPQRMCTVAPHFEFGHVFDRSPRRCGRLPAGRQRINQRLDPRGHRRRRVQTDAALAGIHSASYGGQHHITPGTGRFHQHQGAAQPVPCPHLAISRQRRQIGRQRNRQHLPSAVARPGASG